MEDWRVNENLVLSWSGFRFKSLHLVISCVIWGNFHICKISILSKMFSKSLSNFSIAGIVLVKKNCGRQITFTWHFYTSLFSSLFMLKCWPTYCPNLYLPYLFLFLCLPLPPSYYIKVHFSPFIHIFIT